MNAHALNPPVWAQELLELTLRPRDRDTITGDLLEAYGDTARRAGTHGANLWYARQVASLLLMAAWPAAAMLTIVAFVRFVIDARLPTSDFSERALISTVTMMGAYVLIGVLGAWRTHHARTGAVIALAASMIAFVMKAVLTVVFLAFAHDARTLANIHNSGGLAEDFTLILFPVLPVGMVLATIGAAIGKSIYSQACGATRS